MTQPKTGKLIAIVKSVASLNADERSRMWTVFARYYAEVKHETFAQDLSEKNDVILLLDSGDRSIQGFSTIKVYEERHRERAFLAIFSGDTIVEEEYWGQKALHRRFVRYVVTEKLKRPFTPVFWFLITKGYKTYLLLARNFPEHWPRHTRATPSWEASLIDHLALRKFGKAYDPGRGVLRLAGDAPRLRDGVAPLDAQLLSAPDVRYFVDQNPGHARGEELCCIGRVDALLWLAFTGRLFKHVFQRTSLRARRVLAMATAGLFG